MTLTSAASTLGDSWNRLPQSGLPQSGLPPFGLPQPAPLGARFSPPSLAALDLPQGKVLVVADDAVMALDLQRMLHEAGWRVVGPAATVAEVQRMIGRGDIDCAVLDLDVDRRAPLPIADLLAFADVPFVWLTTGMPGAVPPRHRNRPVVEKPFTRNDLLAAVEKAMAGRREIANDNRWAPAGSVVPWARVYPQL